MNVRDGHHSKKAVTFNMHGKLDDKIDKLMSMMSTLTVQGNKQDKQSSPKYIKEKREDR